MVVPLAKVAVVVVPLVKGYMGSIIVPVFNEQDTVVNCLEKLTAQVNGHWKLIVVDGGSVDETRKRVQQFPVLLLTGEAGRAKQLNLGAQHGEGETLLFLHVDTVLPSDFHQRLQEFTKSKLSWGRFDVGLQPNSLGLQVIAWFMNRRSRITAVATGDQAIFVRSSVFQSLKGYPDIPLMEDVAISKRLKRRSKPFCISSPVISSSRRWQKQGLIKTVLLMWWLRLAYFCGVSPKQLHRWYYPQQS